MSTLRRPFYPEDDFVVARRMIVSNVPIAPDPARLFDKTLVSGRLLRMLYEQGYLEVAAPGSAKEPAPQTERRRRRRFGDGTP